jgi:sugar phosphate isomerase/epimerase
MNGDPAIASHGDLEMQLENGMGHLTYSTLVHPGDTWEEMWESLQTYLPQVKKRVSPRGPFGVSLRISAASAETLVKSPERRDELKRFLAENDLYLYTVNAFPYGSFKNTKVKEQVYEPDWRSEQRTRYTMNVADILVDVAPDFVDPSIQSPPLGFKPNVTGENVIEAYAENIRRVTAHLHRIKTTTGRTVTLAIEPEPACFLETTPETIDFFNAYLRTDRSYADLAAKIGGDRDAAKLALATHVGVVFDVCHQAVEFEDITTSLQALKDHNINVWKLQEAAALMIPEVTREKVDALRPYANSIYLTQTIQRRGGELTRFLNLEDALADWDRSPGPCEWRIHFHVPVFLDEIGPFKTTRFAIEEALAFQKRHKLSKQLEIETYTWDVLPDHLKTGDIVDYVVNELQWVTGQLS